MRVVWDERMNTEETRGWVTLHWFSEFIVVYPLQSLMITTLMTGQWSASFRGFASRVWRGMRRRRSVSSLLLTGS